MVLRFLLRFFSNNEHLVQRLSESYPVRRAAQVFVVVFHRGKGLLEDSGLKHKLTPEEFRAILRKLSETVQQYPKQIQEQFKKK